MRVVTPSAAASDQAPYAAAAAFAKAKACLGSRDAQPMSESDLERELLRRGQELMRKLLQGHLEQPNPEEAAGPVAGADGVARSERRVHQRHLETTLGALAVERLGHARAGHDSLHPLDATLNLPPARHSLEVRRRVAEAASSRSFDEALFDLSRHTGAQVPKRRAGQLVVRAAEDFDAFCEARRAQEAHVRSVGLSRPIRDLASHAGASPVFRCQTAHSLTRGVLVSPAGPHEKIAGVDSRQSVNELESILSALKSRQRIAPNAHYTR